jgi:hypothetical protein
MGHALAALSFRRSQLCLWQQARHDRRGKHEHQHRRRKWTHNSH